MVSEIPIFDFHCHPSLKIYLCNKDISQKHHPLPDILPSGMHVDLPGLAEAKVRVAVCSHYVPEAGLGTMPKSQAVFKLLKKAGINIIDKFEPEDENDDAFFRALWSIKLLDYQIAKAGKQFNVTVTRNLSEFHNSYQSGSNIIIHALEGGHHLGKNLKSAQDYISRLEELKAVGVCLITIGHFFQNCLCDSAGGIPPSTASLLGYNPPEIPGTGLTDVGKKVIEWCQENGIIIDLVHSGIKTREEVYAILECRKNAGLQTRPIIFSHSGIREIASKNMTSESDKLLLPDINELKKILSFGGLIGIILMNYWVVGKEEDNLLKTQNGIEQIINTIEFIRQHTGNFDGIAIGTDLDGFTQVPDDLTHVRHLGRLRSEIFKHFGETATRKICIENAIKVLTTGWS